MPKTILRDRETKPSRETKAFASADESRSGFGANHRGVIPALPLRNARASSLDSVASSDPSLHSAALAETAHDLNNALNAVRLQIDLMALDLLDLGCTSENRVWRRLRDIQAAVGHASDVTGQIRESARRTSGVGKAQAAELNPTLQRMVPVLAAMLPRDITLHLQLTPDLPTVAVGPVQFIRIVANLVLNSCAALRCGASSATGQVVVETALDADGGVVLRVHDTGPGMSASARANIIRLHCTPKVRRNGAGLGLASVLRMVRQVGGAVHIDSTPGIGTTVSIRLRRLEDNPGQKKKGQAAGVFAPIARVNGEQLGPRSRPQPPSG